MIVNLKDEYIVLTEDKVNKLKKLSKDLDKESSRAWDLYHNDYYGEYDSLSSDMDYIEYTTSQCNLFTTVLDIIFDGKMGELL